MNGGNVSECRRLHRQIIYLIFLDKNFTEHAIVDAVELKDPLLDDPSPAAMRRGAYASLQFRSRQSAPPKISAVRTMPERRATIEGGITSPERRQC